MVRGYLRLLTAMLFLLTTSIASAQPPLYEPYGAWRGKIRYVEGPHRVRTHIRWGGGITPTGGQVLMHLGTVAGNVLTNEIFLNSAMGGMRDAEIDPLLQQQVAQVASKNQALLTDLNAIRADLSLAPISFASAPAPVVATGNGQVAGPTNQSLLEKIELDKHVTEIERLGPEVQKLRYDLYRNAHTLTRLVKKLKEAMPAVDLKPEEVAASNRAEQLVALKMLTDRIAPAEKTKLDAEVSERLETLTRPDAIGPLTKDIQAQIAELEKNLDALRGHWLYLLQDPSNDPTGEYGDAVNLMGTWLREIRNLKN